MEVKQLFSETRSVLNKMGFPTDDAEQLINPLREFATGGHYGIELSSMNNPKIILSALKLAKEYDISISRMIECRGIMRLMDAEIKDMVAICNDANVGLILSIGPRAISDTGGFVHSNNGKRIGYRLRGMENIIYAIEDVKRAVHFGVRGFLIYDEGLLYLLNQMRAEGNLPSNIVFKYSVHACCSNPLSAKLLADNGADCINIIPDLTVGMMSAIRQLVDIPLDVFSDTAKEAGGLLRTYEISKIIRHVSPVYLKCGPISQPFQNHLPTPQELEERLKQTKNVQEHIDRYLPEAKRVNHIDPSLCLVQQKKSETYQFIKSPLNQVNGLAMQS